MASTGKILTRSKATVGLDEIIEGMTAFDTKTLEQFMQQVGNLVARKKAPNHLSERESDLLMAINHCIPTELQQRYKALSIKSQSGLLTADEHTEMLRLIDQLEQKHAERLEKLLDLAQLRGVPLKTLMQELQLVPHSYRPNRKHAMPTVQSTNRTVGQTFHLEC